MIQVKRSQLVWILSAVTLGLIATFMFYRAITPVDVARATPTEMVCYTVEAKNAKANVIVLVEFPDGHVTRYDGGNSFHQCTHPTVNQQRFKVVGYLVELKYATSENMVRCEITLDDVPVVHSNGSADTSCKFWKD